MGVLDFAATPHRMAMASSAANPSVVMRTAVRRPRRASVGPGVGVLDFAATPHRMAMASSAANPSVVMRTGVS